MPRTSRVLLSLAAMLSVLGSAWLLSDGEQPAHDALKRTTAEGESPRTESVPGLALLAEVSPPELGALQGSISRMPIAEERRPDEDRVALPLTLAFQVLGPFGAPVEGAVANDSRQQKSRFVRTDSEGKGEFTLRKAQGQELFFAALGYRSTSVLLNQDDLQSNALGQLLTVRLERDSILTISLRGGGCFDGFSLELGTPGELFTRSEYFLSDIQLATGVSSINSASGGRGGERVTLELGPSRRVVMPRITAGVALRLRVLDRYLSVVHEEELAPLGALESRLHEVAITGEAHGFSIAIRNDAGVALG